MPMRNALLGVWVEPGDALALQSRKEPMSGSRWGRSRWRPMNPSLSLRRSIHGYTVSCKLCGKGAVPLLKGGPMSSQEHSTEEIQARVLFER